MVATVDFRGHGDGGPLDTVRVELDPVDLALLIQHLDAGPVGFVALLRWRPGHRRGGRLPGAVRWIVNIDGLGPPRGTVPPDQIPEAVGSRSTAPTRSSSRAARGRRWRRWPSAATGASPHLPEGAPPRSPGAWPVEGGWVWKADPMFGMDPSEFKAVAMLEARGAPPAC